MMRGGGDNDDDDNNKTYDYSAVETSKKVDRFAGESLIYRSRSISQRSSDYAEDSLQSRFCGDGDSYDSLLLGTDEIISGGRVRPSQDKQAAVPTITAKTRKKRKPARRQQHSSENRKQTEGLSSSSLKPFYNFLIIPGKYFGEAPEVPKWRRRERQIKNVYAAPRENTRTPTTVIRATDRKHEASSGINRRTDNIEITRVNKIITDKLLNVRTTIPKTKK